MPTYHMIDYIHEGPDALQRTLEANEDRVVEVARMVKEEKLERVILTGIGSSFTASLMAGPLWMFHSPYPVHILKSSEFINLPPHLVDRKTLVVAVSRSGERGLVVETLRRAVAAGATGVAITGVEDSLLARQGRLTLLTAEGPEITFPKTKSVAACTGLLMRLALALASPDDALAARRQMDLNRLPSAMLRTIEAAEPLLQGFIPEIQRHQFVAFAGTGASYGTAMEGAMKLQEASYVPAYGNSTNAILNGPVGAFNDKWLVISLITSYDKVLSEKLLSLSHSFGAHCMAFVEPGLELGPQPLFLIRVTDRVDPLLASLIYLPPLQLLAYHWTVARGMNPDAPSSMRPILDAILPEGREEPELRSF